jgi:hypothetical protein
MGVTPRTMLRDVIESKRQHEPWIQYCLKNWSSWLEAEQATVLGRRRSLRASHGRTMRDGSLETDETDEALLSLDLVDAFHPIVITRSEWPSVLVPMTSVTLPLQMTKLCDRFASFYRNPAGWQGSDTEALSVVGAGERGSGLAIGSGHVSRKGHKIIWSPTSGSVTLGVSYSSPTDNADVQLSGEIVLSVVQACVLLLFNEARSLTFSFMLDKLGLSEDRLYSDLRALVAPAQPLLVTSLVNFWRLPYTRINLDELRASEFVPNKEFVTVRFGNAARSDRGGRTIPRGRSPPPGTWSPNASGRATARTSSTNVISGGTVHPAAPLVVHEVRDALADALADATAASQLFAWQEEKVKASAMRILKSSSRGSKGKSNLEFLSQAERRPKNRTGSYDGTDGKFSVKAAPPGASEQEDRGLVFTEVVDMVMQHCREKFFDVEKSTVFKALESLCKDGLVERVVVEGELTKLRLVPPEDEAIAEKTDMMVLKDTLSKMKETRTVTGKNLYLLLLVKIQMDIETTKISLDDLTVGLVKLVLPREICGINDVLPSPPVADGVADGATGGGGDTAGGGAGLRGVGGPVTPAGGFGAGAGGFGLGTPAAAVPPNAAMTPENVSTCFWNMKVIMPSSCASLLPCREMPAYQPRHPSLPPHVPPQLGDLLFRLMTPAVSIFLEAQSTALLLQSGSDGSLSGGGGGGGGGGGTAAVWDPYDADNAGWADTSVDAAVLATSMESETSPIRRLCDWVSRDKSPCAEHLKASLQRLYARLLHLETCESAREEAAEETKTFETNAKPTRPVSSGAVMRVLCQATQGSRAK